MTKSVKVLATITISLLCFHLSNAQLKLPVLNNGIGSDIKKVVADYPNQFNNLLGEIIVKNPQSTDYKCNFMANGAESTTVTQYTAKNKVVCSWEAVMLTTENFDKARQEFRKLFSHLNRLPVSIGTGQSYQLKGTYDQPVEEKSFTAILFSFDHTEDTFKKLKVELTLQYEMPEWKVRVFVYDRDRDDNERGNISE